MSEKKKEPTLDIPWYAKDSGRQREAIMHSIEVTNLSTTLRELVFYNQHLLNEISWVESVVATLIIPQLESGKTRESVLNEWIGMIQIDN